MQRLRLGSSLAKNVCYYFLNNVQETYEYPVFCGFCRILRRIRIWPETDPKINIEEVTKKWYILTYV